MPMAKINFSTEERDKLILENMWIVNYLAKKYSGGNPQLFEELQSVGNVGLVKAVDNYSKDMGTVLATYATLLVQGEIRHFLRDNLDVIRIPRKYVSYYKMIQDAIVSYYSENAKHPTIKEIVEITGLSNETIIESLEAGYAKYPFSMEDPISKDEGDIQIKDTISKSTDQVTTAIQKITINSALKKLEPIERKSIVLKYQQDLTTQEIAQKLNVHIGKINRSLKSGLNKLKEIIEKQDQF
jgi:RNA polymerase sporulation-specific sigma factor